MAGARNRGPILRRRCHPRQLRRKGISGNANLTRQAHAYALLLLLPAAVVAVFVLRVSPPVPTSSLRFALARLGQAAATLAFTRNVVASNSHRH